MVRPAPRIGPVEAPDPSDLIAGLVACTEVGATAAEVARAVRDMPEADWPEQLEHVAEAVGLRVRWSRETAASAAALSRLDLPVVTCTEVPSIGARWVALCGVRHGNVRVLQSPDVAGSALVGVTALPRETLGRRRGALHLWGLVEPALPASPFASRTPEDAAPTAWQRLIGLLRVERGDVTAVAVYTLFIGVLNVSVPVAVWGLVDLLTTASWGVSRNLLFAALGTSLMGMGGLVVLRRATVEKIQRRIFVRMVADLSTRLSRVRLHVLEVHTGSTLASRFSDLVEIQRSVPAVLLDGLAGGLALLVALLVLAGLHPGMMLYGLGLVALLGGVLHLLGQRAQRAVREERMQRSAVGAWLTEQGRDPMSFKFGQGPRHASVRIDALAQAYLDARETRWSWSLAQAATTGLAQAVGGVGLLAIGSTAVESGMSSIGQVAAAGVVAGTALYGAGRVVRSQQTLWGLFASIDALGEVVDLPQEGVTGAALPEDDRPSSAALRGVTSGSPDRGENEAPLHLAIRHGSKLAVMVPTAGGGRVASDLLVGARRPASGVVLRDGHDVEDLRPAGLYRSSMLIRGSRLLHESVFENVVMSRPRASILEVRRALQQVGLDAKVRALPEGLDTVITPQGSHLSTADSVRLLVARALVARPRFLVLDHALDGLPDTDITAILAPLKRPRAPWTLVVFTSQARVAAQLPESTDLYAEASHGR